MFPSTARFYPSLPLLLALLLASATAASADDRTWTVITITGAVAIAGSYESGSVTLDARDGTQLVAPFSLRTGNGGHLVIARDKDIMTIGAGTRLDVPVPARNDQDDVIRIRQAFGSVLYQAGHRQREIFEVHTPYLVSAVNGTTVKILVSKDMTTVDQIEGPMHIYTPDTKYEAFLEAGQVATRSAGDEGIRIVSDLTAELEDSRNRGIATEPRS
jgi:hypothetical protein